VVCSPLEPTSEWAAFVLGPREVCSFSEPVPERAAFVLVPREVCSSSEPIPEWAAFELVPREVCSCPSSEFNYPLSCPSEFNYQEVNGQRQNASILDDMVPLNLPSCLETVSNAFNDSVAPIETLKASGSVYQVVLSPSVLPLVEVTSDKLDELEFEIVASTSDNIELHETSSSACYFSLPLDSSLHQQNAVSVVSDESLDQSMSRERETNNLRSLDVIMEDEEPEDDCLPTEVNILPVEEKTTFCDAPMLCRPDFRVSPHVFQEHDEEWETVASSRTEWANRLRKLRSVPKDYKLGRLVNRVQTLPVDVTPGLVLSCDLKSQEVVCCEQTTPLSCEQENVHLEEPQEPMTTPKKWFTSRLQGFWPLFMLLFHGW